MNVHARTFGYVSPSLLAAIILCLFSVVAEIAAVEVTFNARQLMEDASSEETYWSPFNSNYGYEIYTEGKKLDFPDGQLKFRMTGIAEVNLKPGSYYYRLFFEPSMAVNPRNEVWGKFNLTESTYVLVIPINVKDPGLVLHHVRQFGKSERKTIFEGESVDLDARAGGNATPPIRYQWFKNGYSSGDILKGCTESHLSYFPADDAQYYVRAYNDFSEVYSGPYIVDVKKTGYSLTVRNTSFSPLHLRMSTRIKRLDGRIENDPNGFIKAWAFDNDRNKTMLANHFLSYNDCIGFLTKTPHGELRSSDGKTSILASMQDDAVNSNQPIFFPVNNYGEAEVTFFLDFNKIAKSELNFFPSRSLPQTLKFRMEYWSGDKPDAKLLDSVSMDVTLSGIGVVSRCIYSDMTEWRLDENSVRQTVDWLSKGNKPMENQDISRIKDFDMGAESGYITVANERLQIRLSGSESYSTLSPCTIVSPGDAIKMFPQNLELPQYASRNPTDTTSGFKQGHVGIWIEFYNGMNGAVYGPTPKDQVYEFSIGTSPAKTGDFGAWSPLVKFGVKMGVVEALKYITGYNLPVTGLSVAHTVYELEKHKLVYVVLNSAVIMEENSEGSLEFTTREGKPFLFTSDQTTNFISIPVGQTVTITTNLSIKVQTTSSVTASRADQLLDEIGYVGRPQIWTTSQNVQIAASSNATLRVFAEGFGMAFQWYQGLSGDTSRPQTNGIAAVFQTPALFESQAYWVRISGASGVADSDTIWVTVTPKNLSPQIWKTAYDTGGQFTFKKIASGVGLLVAVGSQGTIATSTNGTDWQVRTNLLTTTDDYNCDDLSDVGYANNQFVVIGSSQNYLSKIWSSTNGIDWVERSRQSYPNGVNSVVNGDGKWLALGYYSTNIYTSLDGIHWETKAITNRLQSGSVSYGNGSFVADADSKGLLLTSADGVAWTTRSSGLPSYCNETAYGNETFVAVGESRSATSKDGIQWEAGPELYFSYAVDFANGHFFALGTSGTLYSSVDGRDWIKHSTDLSYRLTGAAYMAGHWVVVGEKGILINSNETLPNAKIPANSLALWVAADMGIRKNAMNAVDWWKEQSGSLNYLSQSTAILQPAWTSNAINKLPALHFDKNNIEQSYTGVNLFRSNAVTVFAVLKPSAQKARNTVFSWMPNATNLFGLQASWDGAIQLLLGNPDRGSKISATQPNGWTGQWHMLDMSIQGTQGDMWVDGKAVASNLPFQGFANTSQYGSLKIGKGLTAEDDYEGELAEIVIYSNGLTGPDRQTVRDYLMQKYGLGSGVIVTPLDPPVIGTQPKGQNALTGSTAQFSVDASGTEPLSYQWRKNGIKLSEGGNVAGSQTKNLTLSNVQLVDAGEYSVVVSNSAGSVTSAVAVFVVTVPSSTISFKDDFERTDLGTNWTIVDAPKAGTSVWGIRNGVLFQDSNIYRSDIYEGTMAIVGSPSWTDYSLIVNVKSRDNDGWGVIFRYQNASNYYRFFTVSEGGPFVLVEKCVNGKYTTLAEDASLSFEVNASYQVRIDAYGDRITVWSNADRIAAIQDATFLKGQVGLCTWACQIDATDLQVLSERPSEPTVSIEQWDFDQKDLRATVGLDLGYFSNTVSNKTRFGSTRDFGLPDIGGQFAQVMEVPALDPMGGYKMRSSSLPNGGGRYINRYTLIMDILYPANTESRWGALLQTYQLNADDGDFFVDIGGGIGISGEYDGTVKLNTWYRIAFAVDLTVPSVAKFIDGVKVGTQTLDKVDGRWALSSSYEPKDYALLFADDNGETSLCYVNSVQFRAARIPDAEIVALGRASASGIGGFQSGTNQSPYLQWVALHKIPSTSNGRNQSIAGDDVPNMLKFVFGLDPWKATRGNLISPIIEVRSGQKYFGIEFPRSKQAVDVPIILQFTSDLKTWQSAISILNKMGDIDAQRERIQLMQTEPIGSGSKRYYRLIIPE